MSVLRLFYELGVRYLTLTHNCNTPWADNHNQYSQSNVPKIGGLTEFGRDIVREMNRLGMMVCPFDFCVEREIGFKVTFVPG